MMVRSLREKPESGIVPAPAIDVAVLVQVCTEGGGGSMNKRFTFDQVFGPEATQEEAMAAPSFGAALLYP